MTPLLAFTIRSRVNCFSPACVLHHPVIPTCIVRHRDIGPIVLECTPTLAHNIPNQTYYPDNVYVPGANFTVQNVFCNKPSSWMAQIDHEGCESLMKAGVMCQIHWKAHGYFFHRAAHSLHIAPNTVHRLSSSFLSLCILAVSW